MNIFNVFNGDTFMGSFATNKIAKSFIRACRKNPFYTEAKFNIDKSQIIFTHVDALNLSEDIKIFTDITLDKIPDSCYNMYNRKGKLK